MMYHTNIIRMKIVIGKFLERYLGSHILCVVDIGFNLLFHRRAPIVGGSGRIG